MDEHMSESDGAGTSNKTVVNEILSDNSCQILITVPGDSCESIHNISESPEPTIRTQSTQGNEGVVQMDSLSGGDNGEPTRNVVVLPEPVIIDLTQSTHSAESVAQIDSLSSGDTREPTQNIVQLPEVSTQSTHAAETEPDSLSVCSDVSSVQNTQSVLNTAFYIDSEMSETDQEMAETDPLPSDSTITDGIVREPLKEMSGTISLPPDSTITDNVTQEPLKEMSGTDPLPSNSTIAESVVQEPFNIQYDFTATPTQVAWASIGSEDGGENFFKGCKWSPDGTCLLTNSEDKCLRVYELPQQLYGGDPCYNTELTPVLQMREGEVVYDYAWYPMMSSTMPDTCCIACSCRDAPVHMWDAFTGSIRCSYLCYTQMDELVAPHSLCFSLCGSKLYCGLNKRISIFDISRPGRKCEERKTFAKKKGQSGIISCISMSPDQHTYAVGTYSKTVGVYEERSTKLLFLVQGQIGGVTHLVYSTDGNKLYSGGRKDTEILCWDVRNPGRVLYVLERDVQTNQRIYFDRSRDGKYIASGNHDGTVKFWDTHGQYDQSSEEPVLPSIGSFPAHMDTVNGASFHPCLSLLATSSGRRRFPMSIDSDESETEDCGKAESTVKLWWCGVGDT